jgi:signal transduction histidine kinase
MPTRHRRILFSRLISVLLFVLAAAGTWQLAAWVAAQESALVRRESAAMTAAAIGVVETAVRSNAAFVERVANVARSREGEDASQVRQEAALLVAAEAGLRDVWRVDESGEIVWWAAAEHVAPPSTAKANVRRLLHRGADAASGGWHLRTVGDALVTVHPLGEEGGAVIGVLDAERALQPLLELAFQGRGIQVRMHDATVFARFVPDPADADAWGATGPLDLGGARVWVATWPSSDALAASRPNVARVVLWVGLLASVLLAGFVYAGQRSALAEIRAREEAARRRATEQALRELNERLDERIRERTEALARSNRDLEQFAYAASHDLQEPLRMVVSYLQLLEQRIGASLAGDEREFLHYAVDGGRRMRALIRGLLAYARVDQQPRSEARVDLDACAATVSRDLELLRIERTATLDIGPLGAVPGDEAQLTQVLTNLIANAFRYGGERPRVEVQAAPDRSVLRLTVRDYGPGIPSDDRERVFELFQRLHTQEEAPGTGMGLALSRRIAEHHGGTLRVVETDGQGATLELRLPLRAAPPGG